MNLTNESKITALFSFILVLICIPFWKTDVRAETVSENQEPSVSYLGPEGTYTQEACQLFFSEKGECLPYGTVIDAVDALMDQETDYAVIPQENTIGGAVIDYIDIVIAREDLYVTGEIELPISQNLLTLPGTSLSDIRKVYSHKQGIAQGKEWLDSNLPGAEVIEVSSTAEGARLVSESGDPSLAAIASAPSAAVYGLDILAANIQNNDNNKTRFYVLSTEKPDTDSGERLAFVAAGSAADLPALMSDLAGLGMKLVTIHDRPQKTELGEYYYLIECSGSTYEDYEQLRSGTPFTLRFLGSFDIR